MKKLSKVSEKKMNNLVTLLISLHLFYLTNCQECQREETIDCSPAINSRYRTLDGSCNRGKLNDEEKAKWNKAYTCYPRIIEADYPDYWGEEIRKSITGSSLPNARDLSNFISSEDQLLSKVNLVSRKHSQMLMNFGQVLGNEITYPANVFTYSPDYTDYNCCANNFPPRQPKWPDCKEVRFTNRDPFYSKFGVSCINFSRSQSCELCKPGQRTGINMHTPAIDVSTIYGNSLNDSNNKREFVGGRLKLDLHQYPINAGKKEVASCGKRWSIYYPHEQGLHCFRAGDTYANNNPPKASLVIIFYRQHNRIANLLSQVNSNWNDEKIFQETRKILGAQFEMITYNEFLPEIIGPQAMKIYSLEVLKNGYINLNKQINPSTTAEFSTSIMRSVGHSMINGNVKAKFFDGRTISFKLHDFYHYLPNFTQAGMVDAYMKGSITEPIKKVDTLFDITIRGFSERIAKNGPKYGADLVTIDLMRGRDFGVPSYTKFRQFCYNELISSFDELDGIFEPEILVKLSSLYKSVDDIDLYYGILAERKVPGALIGPTGVCLWAREFYNKKFGDRYYFEQGGQSGSFTPKQLATIRKTTLAKLICSNGDFYPQHSIQKFVMRLPDPLTNPEVECSDLPDLDISAWREDTNLDDYDDDFFKK